MSAFLLETKRIRNFSGSFRTHFHEEYSVAFVREGFSRAAAPSGSVDVYAGNLVLIPEGVPHACNPDIRGAWAYTLLLIDPAWIRGLSGDPTIRTFLSTPDIKVLPAPPDAAEALEEADSSRTSSDRRCRQEAEDRLKTTILAVAENFVNEGGRPAARLRPRRVDVPDSRAEKMAAYLREGVARRATLRELSVVAGLCERAALRVFRETYGMPPYSFLTNLRVNEAKRLLRSGTPPSQAALAVGFYDQSHLNRVFARHVGLTPAVYANRCGREVRIVQDGSGRKG